MADERIYVEWANGAYVSSLHDEFQKVVEEETAKQGKPIVVEFRDENNWVDGNGNKIKVNNNGLQ